jgi:hypothetical protein
MSGKKSSSSKSTSDPSDTSNKKKGYDPELQKFRKYICKDMT